MKHGRGINLLSAATRMSATVPATSDMPPYSYPTFETLEQWYVLGGKCKKCGRQGWVDRWELQRTYGKKTYIIQLARLLRCRQCGNKGDNEWILGKLAR